MASDGFKDHFSGVAGDYAAARPEYPDALFDAVAATVPASARAWEPGCGSGQATRGLAARFAHVHATDPAAEQLSRHWAAGTGDPRVSLAVEPGESTALHDGSVGLAAVAQALHWFDRPRFFRECQRVLSPGGVLAAWGYGDFLPPEGMLDAVADYRRQSAPYWPAERVEVDAAYAGYDWPFPALPTAPAWLEAEWSLQRFLRYLASSSACHRCLQASGDDPVARHAPALAAAWGDPADLRLVQWPLFLHLRRKPRWAHRKRRRGSVEHCIRSAGMAQGPAVLESPCRKAPRGRPAISTRRLQGGVEFPTGGRRGQAVTPCRREPASASGGSSGTGWRVSRSGPMPEPTVTSPRSPGGHSPDERRRQRATPRNSRGAGVPHALWRFSLTIAGNLHMHQTPSTTGSPATAIAPRANGDAKAPVPAPVRRGAC